MPRRLFHGTPDACLALIGTYEWYIAFLAAVECVLEARVALVNAERPPQTVGSNAKVSRVAFDPMIVSDIDAELLAWVPRGQGQIAEARVGRDVVLHTHADTGSSPSTAAANRERRPND